MWMCVAPLYEVTAEAADEAEEEVVEVVVAVEVIADEAVVLVLVSSAEVRLLSLLVFGLLCATAALCCAGECTARMWSSTQWSHTTCRHVRGWQRQ